VKPLVIGIGELLWDLLPDGRRLGGAPANFAYHASRLGCRGALVSRVGDDDLGREALAKLASLGVDRSRIQMDPSLPTGTVEVTLDAQGNPAYGITRNVAWDALACPDSLSSLAPEADAICFGTLAARDPRTRETLVRFLAAAGKRPLRILDVNLRPTGPEDFQDLLGLCDVLKLNESELPVVAGLCGVEGDLLQGLRTRFNLKLVALTLGERGSILCTEDVRMEMPGMALKVVDTVGAGNAFTAALAAGMIQGLDLRVVQRRATRLAAYVCTQAGAMPETGEFLRMDPHFR
jgi:fructokinase